jgi:hypothetical protein
MINNAAMRGDLIMIKSKTMKYEFNKTFEMLVSFDHKENDIFEPTKEESKKKEAIKAKFKKLGIEYKFLIGETATDYCIILDIQNYNKALRAFYELELNDFKIK